MAPFRRTSSHRRCGNVGWSPYLAVGGFCRRVFNPAHQGIDFLIEILSKSHLGQPPPQTPYIPTEATDTRSSHQPRLSTRNPDLTNP